MTRTATKTKSKREALKIAKRQEVATRQNPRQTRALAPLPDNKPKTVMQAIFEASQNPKLNPENMRLLLDMQKEVMAEEARMEFIRDFMALKTELPTINRDGKIVILEKGADGKRVEGRDKVQQSTRFATYENLQDVCDPILLKHNFTLTHTSEPNATNDRLLITAILMHRRGHEMRATFPLPAEASGSKNNVQAWGSSAKYGRRYTMIIVLNIRTVDPNDRDTDGIVLEQKAGEIRTIDHDTGSQELQPPKPLTHEQKFSLDVAIQEAGVSAKQFCEVYQIAKVHDLPSNLFDAAIKRCRDHARNRSK